MRLDKSSPTGLRLFSSLRSGRSLTRSARAAGVGKGPAQRWIREEFNELRDAGLSVLEAQELLGFASSLMPAWDHARLVSDSRHHLATSDRGGVRVLVGVRERRVVAGCYGTRR